MVDWAKHSEIRALVMPLTHQLSEVYVKDASMTEEMSKIFHTTTAKLLYLCKRARPDVQLPVLFMCTRVREPTVTNKSKLDRILGYLSKTLHRRRRICSVVGALKLHCYIDASFATHPDGKGHTWVIINVKKHKHSNRVPETNDCNKGLYRVRYCWVV